MRKILLALVTTLLVGSATAGVFVDYQCEAPNLPYINKLVLQGEVELYTPAGIFEGNQIELALTAAGLNMPTLNYFEERTGAVTYYPAGQMALNEVFHITSVDKDGAIKLVNILIGHPGKLSSFVRTADGREFRGKCSFSF